LTEFNWTAEELQEIVDGNRLVLFMKGTPEQPQCGFSARAAMVYQQLEIPFVSVNILADSRAIPAVCEWSDWPTMPQCYIDGELIGGSDIVFEMFESGELLEMISEGK
jgi:monothiol glutaredoxin|tara:strand:+ start:619 stop:942 length:324 start_codon:yes stop_codon:yes gene_type:complete